MKKDEEGWLEACPLSPCTQCSGCVMLLCLYSRTSTLRDWCHHVQMVLLPWRGCGGCAALPVSWYAFWRWGCTGEGKEWLWGYSFSQPLIFCQQRRGRFRSLPWWHKRNDNDMTTMTEWLCVLYSVFLAEELKTTVLIFLFISPRINL